MSFLFSLLQSKVVSPIFLDFHGFDAFDDCRLDRMSQYSGLSALSSWVDSGSAGTPQKECCVLLSAFYREMCDVALSLAGGDHRVPLVRVVSTRLLHRETSLFLFVVSGYLVGSFSEIVHRLSCSSPNSLTCLSMALTFFRISQGNSRVLCMVRSPWQDSLVLRSPHLKIG